MTTTGRMAEWHNGRMAGMVDGIHIDDLIVVLRQNGRMAAEWRTEWSNGGNGQMAEMADGMVEWQTKMATYVLFMVHTNTNDNDDDSF